jgi:hypothetical protein
MASFEDRQAQLDAMLTNSKGEALSVENRLLKIAVKGMDEPLTQEETKQICYALVIVYHQMGIE